MPIENTLCQEQIQALSEFQRLAHPANTPFVVATIESWSELDAGLGFSFALHQEHPFDNAIDNSTWAVAIWHGWQTDKLQLESDMSVLAMTGQIPEHVTHIAMFLVDSSSVSEEAIELAKDALRQAGISIIYEEALTGRYPKELFAFAPGHACRLGEQTSRLTYRPFPAYASRFSEEDLCRVMLIHFAGALAPEEGKETVPSREQLLRAARTLKAISFGRFSLPEQYAEMADANAPIPDELLRTCCPSGADTPSGKLAKLVGLGAELLDNWAFFLEAHGLSLQLGADGEHGIIPDAACELALSSGRFKQAVMEYCSHPGDDEQTALEMETGRLNWERADMFDDAFDMSPSPETESELSRELEDLLLPVADTSDQETSHQDNAQTTALDNAVARLFSCGKGEPRQALFLDTRPVCEGGGVLLNNIYDAVGFELDFPSSFSHIEPSMGEGSWSAMFLDEVCSPLQSPFSYAAALAVAGMVPAGCSKVAVLAGRWGEMNEDGLMKIRKELALAGVAVLSDPTGVIAPDAVGTEEMESLFEEIDVYSPDDGFSLPYPYLSYDVLVPEVISSKVAAVHRHWRAAHMAEMLIAGARELREGELSSKLKQLSCGRAKASDVALLDDMPAMSLDGMFDGYRLATLTAGLFRPDDRRIPAEPWEGAFAELRDLHFIWQDMASQQPGLVAASDFPLGYPAEALEAVAGIFGIPKGVEAYYNGVPMEDILSKEGWQDYLRIINGEGPGL